MDNSAIDIIRATLSYSSLFIFLFGLFGNILMFLVFTLSKNLSKLSISTYYRWIALVNLAITFNWIKIFTEYQYHYLIDAQSNSTCIAYIYFSYCIFPISTLTSAAISLDRTAKILFSTRFQILNKKRFQLAVIVIICLYTFVSYFFFSIFGQNISVETFNSSLVDKSQPQSPATVQTNQTTIIKYCVMKHRLRHVFADFINSTVIPFCLMLSSSIATIFHLVRSRNRVVLNNPSADTRRRQQRDTKFGITSIFLNIAFFVMNAPISFLNIITFFTNNQSPSSFPHSNPSLEFMFHALYSIDYAFYFYIQLGVNSLVRQELMNVFQMLKVTMNRRRVELLGKIRKDKIHIGLTKLPIG